MSEKQMPAVALAAERYEKPLPLREVQNSISRDDVESIVGAIPPENKNISRGVSLYSLEHIQHARLMPYKSAGGVRYEGRDFVVVTQPDNSVKVLVSDSAEKNSNYFPYATLAEGEADEWFLDATNSTEIKHLPLLMPRAVERYAQGHVATLKINNHSPHEGLDLQLQNLHKTSNLSFYSGVSEREAAYVPLTLREISVVLSNRTQQIRNFNERNNSDIAYTNKDNYPYKRYIDQHFAAADTFSVNMKVATSVEVELDIYSYDESNDESNKRIILTETTRDLRTNSMPQTRHFEVSFDSTEAADIILGRDPDADIVFPSQFPVISRTHGKLRLVRTPDGLELDVRVGKSDSKPGEESKAQVTNATSLSVTSYRYKKDNQANDSGKGRRVREQISSLFS